MVDLDPMLTIWMLSDGTLSPSIVGDASRTDMELKESWLGAVGRSISVGRSRGGVMFTFSPPGTMRTKGLFHLKLKMGSLVLDTYHGSLGAWKKIKHQCLLNMTQRLIVFLHLSTRLI